MLDFSQSDALRLRAGSISAAAQPTAASLGTENSTTARALDSKEHLVFLWENQHMRPYEIISGWWCNNHPEKY